MWSIAGEVGLNTTTPQHHNGRVLLGPISTWAIVFFYSGQFYLGQVRLRPILACPLDHPKCQDEKNEKWNLDTNTAYARLSGFNRPLCEASPAEGRRSSTWRSVEGRKAGIQGFRVQGSGFWVLGFGLQGLGFSQGLGFRSLGFRV